LNGSKTTTRWLNRIFLGPSEIRLFLTVFLVLVFFVSIGPGRTQGARVMAHAHALLYEGRNTIDTYHWNTIDKAYFNGHYYTSAGPGMGYLAVAPLMVWDVLFRCVPSRLNDRLNAKMKAQLESRCAPLIEAGYLSFDPAKNKVNLFEFHASIWVFELFVSLFTAASAVICFRMLQLFGVVPSLAFNSSIILCFGTILFFYSRLAYSVAPSAFLLLLAFYFVVHVTLNPGSSRADAARLGLAGAALGVAVATEYIQIIGAALMFLFAWRRLGSRRVTILAYKHLIPLFDAKLSPGVMGLSYPAPDRLLALTFGIRRGLFIYDPVLLFTLFLVARNLMRSREYIAESLLVVGISVGYVLFQAACASAWETWGIGPRYAAVVVPFLMFGALFIRGKIELQLFYGLAMLSLLVNWLTVQHDIEAMHSSFPLRDAMRAFFDSGPSSNLLEETCSLLRLNSGFARWAIGLAAYAILFGGIFLIWAKTKTETTSKPESRKNG